MTTERSHCCTTEATPERENPPGQRTLRTRVGDWARFRQRMLGALGTQTVPPDGEPTDPRPLRALTTRAADDGTISLIDAWASTCDVLAFYGERILNEGYLGTAEQRRSVVEIARMLGYQPSPGVAASTRLALTMQASPLAPGEVALEPGIAVMSVPPEGKQPQVFETTEAVHARVEYNELAPRRTRPHAVGNSDDELWLAGVASRLEPGNTLVIAQPTRATSTGAGWHAARVVRVEIDVQAQRTRVVFDPPISGFGSSTTEGPLVIAFRQRAGIFGWNAPDFHALSSELKGSYLNQASLDISEFFSIVTILPSDATLGGYFAVPLVAHNWPNFDVGSGDEPDYGVVHLDRETEVVAPRSWVYLEDADSKLLGHVTEVGTVSRVDFTLTGKVTAVSFDDTSLAMSAFARRGTVVHISSEELPVTEAPISDSVGGLRIELSTTVPEMEPGRTLLIAGSPAGGGAPVVLEAIVAGWDTEGGLSVIVLEEELPPLERATVRIWGNTALATHGSRISGEVVGSGDATVPNQRFALRQGPLTWVSAGTTTGAEATVELRINGVLWQRVESLYDAGPSDRVYVIEEGEDGRAELVVGDGLRGARAQTGQDNVVVTYRKGIGLDGEVGANLLTLLQTRPVGLFGVTNPSPARGAADPESLDEARVNAPLQVLTLGRLVSLSDYGDFARAFAGVGKARATALWDGRRAFVQLTVASASGQPFSPGDQVLDSLESAIEEAGDPTHVVHVDGHLDVRFKVKLKLAINPAHERADVESAVRGALTDAYRFEVRDFGQPVALSEVAAVVHAVAGVVAVDIDALWVEGTPKPHAVLRAALPSWTGGGVSQAELLLVDPEGIEILEMQP